MSLLNDALRKRRTEERPLGESLGTPLIKPWSKAKRRNRWIAALCGFALLAAGSAAWWYGAAFETTSGSAVVVPSADLPEAHADDPSNKQTALPLALSVEVTPTSRSQAADADTILHQRVADVPLNQPVGASASLTEPHPSPAISAEPSVKQPVLKPAAKPREHAPRRETAGNAPGSISSAPATRTTNQGHRQRIESLYQKAQQYHRRNRLEQAIALYQEVLKADPKHEKARFNLVAAYLQVEAFTKAYPMAAELYLQEPDNQQVMLNLAIAQIGCGRPLEAINLLDKAASRSDAALFEIAFHKAVAFRRLNQVQDALIWYKRAEAIRPDDPGLLFNLAVAHDQQQEYEEAIAYYLRCIGNDKDRDPLTTAKIRDRIRILQAYHSRKKFGE